MRPTKGGVMEDKNDKIAELEIKIKVLEGKLDAEIKKSQDKDAEQDEKLLKHKIGTTTSVGVLYTLAQIIVELLKSNK